MSNSITLKQLLNAFENSTDIKLYATDINGESIVIYKGPILHCSKDIDPGYFDSYIIGQSDIENDCLNIYLDC